MVEIANSGDLRAWLRGKPKVFSVAIASRAALRTLPALVKFSGQDTYGYESQDIILPSFRAVHLALFAGKNHKITKNVAFVSNAISAAAATRSARSSTESETKRAYAAEGGPGAGAARAAAFAVETTSASDTNNAAFCARSAAYSADTVYDAAAGHAANLAYASDATLLESGIKSDKLVRMLLWQQGMPAEMEVLWDELKNRLNRSANNWQVWTDWYDDILVGRNRVGLQDDLAEELDQKIALQEDKWWMSGAAVVNGDIKNWTAEFFERNEARRRVAQQNEFAVSHMTEWFHSNFEDPRNQTSFDPKSGNYIYSEGGPYDAREQLERLFLKRYLDELIDIAVETVETEGIKEWAPIHEQGLINNPEWNDIPWSVDEPEFAIGPNYKIVDGKISLVAHFPLENEITTQSDLHQNLQHQVRALVSAVGSLENQYPALVGAVKEYADVLNGGIEELDITGVWSVGGAFGSFQIAYAQQSANGTLEIPLEPNIVAQLQSISRMHGAFIMGFSEGRELVERADAFLLDVQLLEDIEIPGNLILDELSENVDLVDDDTRAKHRPVRDVLRDFGWASVRNGYNGYAIVTNIAIATTKFILKTFAVIAVVQTASIALGDPNMLVAKAAIEYLQIYGPHLLSFFNHSPEMRAYIEHALNTINDYSSHKNDAD